MVSDDGDRRPGRLEILGAWLHIWTPPRDAQIPPVPWRWVAAGAVLVAALVVVVAVAVAPSIESGKRETEAREERRLDTALRERAARVRREQRPRFGRVAFVRGGAGGAAVPAARPGARRAILRRIELAVTRDARARHGAGELARRAVRTRCEPFPPRAAGAPAPAPRRREAYDCLAVTTTIARNERDRRSGSLGYPFRAIVDFGRATWAFCKINPVAGERVIPDPRRIVELPDECQL